MVSIKSPVINAKGVGPKLNQLFNRMGIYTIEDLLMHFPRLYEDRNSIKPIKLFEDGENEGVVGTATLIDRDRYTSTGKHVTRIVLKNDTGYVIGVWYNQKFIKKNFKIGERYLLYGKVSKNFGEIQILNPEYEKIDEENNHKIVPIYPITKNLPQKTIRNLIYKTINTDSFRFDETLPEAIRDEFKLCDINTAIHNIHFPENNDKKLAAEKRLKFEELFKLQLGLMLEKNKSQNSSGGISFIIPNELTQFVRSLPFELTNAQKKAVNEILRDMKSEKPMNRLVQGDVGSGKTVVAVISLFCSVKNGYQGVLMAPTEILASQHFETLTAFYKNSGIRIGYLSGRLSKKQKEEIVKRLSSGDIDILVGTHAVLEENITFKKLGLVITDEQHRFGVRQRTVLYKKGENPDMLVMTATPIPRTMALFIYGDLDISIIDELPPGRKKIDTFVADSSIRGRIYNFVRKEVDKGRQAYVVCPLIEDSDSFDAKSAVQTYEKLENEYLTGVKLGLLHGKMKTEEKEKIMEEFKKGDINVLVSTTVIEVGINVANASIMVVESANRFGLSELHQLRGRVGRGEYKSYCILISDMKTDISMKRMKIMQETDNGFEIADKDMEIRGTGEFLGTRQHGIPDLKLADMVKDSDILKLTNKLAKDIIASGKIEKDEFKKLREEINDEFYNINEKIILN